MVGNPYFVGYHFLPQIGPLTTLQPFLVLVLALALVMGNHGGGPMDLNIYFNEWRGFSVVPLWFPSHSTSFSKSKTKYQPRIGIKSLLKAKVDQLEPKGRNGPLSKRSYPLGKGNNPPRGSGWLGGPLWRSNLSPNGPWTKHPSSP